MLTVFISSCIIVIHDFLCPYHYYPSSHSLPWHIFSNRNGSTMSSPLYYLSFFLFHDVACLTAMASITIFANSFTIDKLSTLKSVLSIS